MPSDRTALLIIRAWIEDGSPGLDFVDFPADRLSQGHGLAAGACEEKRARLGSAGAPVYDRPRQVIDA